MSQSYETYVKNKTSYLRLRNLNQIGGSKYNRMAAELLKQGVPKTKILSTILSQIAKDADITNKEYMIIASYCLHEIREIGDLDVVILKDAYEKLKKHKIGEISTAKISGDERIVIKFPELGSEAEIEFFPKDKDVGFPSNDFSMEKMQKNNHLLYDENLNAYYDIEMCVRQYADVKKVSSPLSSSGDVYYILGDSFKVDDQRVKKNISHLEKLLEFYRQKDKTIFKFIDKNIQYLKSLLPDT